MFSSICGTIFYSKHILFLFKLFLYIYTKSCNQYKDVIWGRGVGWGNKYCVLWSVFLLPTTLNQWLMSTIQTAFLWIGNCILLNLYLSVIIAHNWKPLATDIICLRTNSKRYLFMTTQTRHPTSLFGHSDIDSTEKWMSKPT